MAFSDGSSSSFYISRVRRERGDLNIKEVMGRLLLPLLFVGFASPSSEVDGNKNPQNDT